ncbi:MAG: FAD-dependent oxidoreductase, partial [Ginsengibacter sp.]
MNRRNFVELLGLGSGAFAAGGIPFFLRGNSGREREGFVEKRKEIFADVVIAGAGIGGFAAAMAALRNGQSVILTEETDWIGGQFTQQGLSCPDEHPWIETHGATQLYRDFRTAVREYYGKNYPLTDAARDKKNFNPGDGLVSALCFEPRVALAVFYEFLSPYFNSGKLHLLL